MSKHDYDSFLFPADEWFITYALPPPLPSVKLFAIGHTIELYLKAANTKITKDIDRSVGFGHDLKKIWDDCKQRDPQFMPSREIRESVYKAEILTRTHPNLVGDDLKHWFDNQELYIIVKHLADCKYFGAPLKTIKRAFAYGFIHPNDYWIHFIKEMRSYLGHPARNKLDIIRNHIDRGELPSQTTQYLKQLYV